MTPPATPSPADLDRAKRLGITLSLLSGLAMLTLVGWGVPRWRAAHAGPPTVRLASAQAGGQPAPPPDVGFSTVPDQPDRDPFARAGGSQPSPDGEASGGDGGAPPAAGAGDGGAGEDNGTAPATVGPITPLPRIDEPPSVDDGPPAGGDEGPADDGGDAPQPRNHRRQQANAKPSQPAAPSREEWRLLDPASPPGFTQPPAAGTGGWQLVAIIRSGRPVAVFRGDQGYQRVAVGEQLGDLTLERVVADGVYLVQNGARFKLPLAPRSGPAAAPAGEPDQAGEPAATPPAPAPAARPAGAGERPAGGRQGQFTRPGGRSGQGWPGGAAGRRPGQGRPGQGQPRPGDEPSAGGFE